jgi:hypothetical protein
MNVLTAQALRRMTGEGASPRTSSRNSPTSPFTSSGFHHLPAANAHFRDKAHTQLPSYMPPYDSSMSDSLSTSHNNGSSPIFNMGGFSAPLPQPGSTRPNLSLLTDVGRKYPGFPTPLSPTPSAKELYPSPASEIGSRAATPRPLSPVVRSVSPMSLDGSEMCGPSRRCYSHGYEHYASNLNLIDTILTQDNANPNNATCLHSPPPSPQHTMSSPRSLSPKTTMLKSMLANQYFPPISPNAIPKTYTLHLSPPSSPDPVIHIANGTSTSTSSPLSPTGTMLSYTSRRPITSGLLGVRPLSETEVAEYRFWSPCGDRRCAFGCGGADLGERAAAKRLFREIDVEDVEDVEGDEDSYGRGERGAGKEGDGDEGGKASVWAGRRLVGDWEGFLRGCEREGIARF